MKPHISEAKNPYGRTHILAVSWEILHKVSFVTRRSCFHVMSWASSTSLCNFRLLYFLSSWRLDYYMFCMLGTCSNPFGILLKKSVATSILQNGSFFLSERDQMKGYKANPPTGPCSSLHNLSCCAIGWGQIWSRTDITSNFESAVSPCSSVCECVNVRASVRTTRHRELWRAR